MERTYTFAEKQYRYKVVYIGYLMLLIMAFSLYRLIATLSLLWLIPLLVAGYGCMNTYLTKSNPRQIVVSDDQITFRSYGEKTFQIASLNRFRVRVSTAGYQVYIRVRDQQGHRGRFWVNYALFDHKEDLIQELDYLERKCHPDSLRFRGRPKLGQSRPQEKPEEPEAKPEEKPADKPESKPAKKKLARKPKKEEGSTP